MEDGRSQVFFSLSMSHRIVWKQARARGHVNENPNIQENTQAIRVVGSVCRGPVKLRRETVDSSIFRG